MSGAPDYGAFAAGAADGSTSFTTDPKIVVDPQAIVEIARALGTLHYVLNDMLKNEQDLRNTLTANDLAKTTGGETLFNSYSRGVSNWVATMNGHVGIVADLLNGFLAAAKAYQHVDHSNSGLFDSQLWDHGSPDNLKATFDDLVGIAPNGYQSSRLSNDVSALNSEVAREESSLYGNRSLDSYSNTPGIDVPGTDYFTSATDGHVAYDPNDIHGQLGFIPYNRIFAHQRPHDLYQVQTPDITDREAADEEGHHSDPAQCDLDNPWFWGNYPFRSTWANFHALTVNGAAHAQAVGDLWRDLATSLSRQYQAVDNKLRSLSDDTWAGAGKDNAANAVSSYCAELDKLCAGMKTIGESYDHTAAWLGRFHDAMPNSPAKGPGAFYTDLPKDGNLNQVDPDVTGYFAPDFERTFNNGIKHSIKSVPDFAAPAQIVGSGTGTGPPPPPSYNNDQSGGSPASAPGSLGGAPSMAGLPGPSIPTGPSSPGGPTSPTDPATQGLTALAQGLTAAESALQSLGQSGTQQSAGDSALTAAGQAASQGASGMQQALQAAQQAAQAMQAGPQSINALADKLKAAGLSGAGVRSAKDGELAGAIGGMGGGAGAGAAAAAGEAEAMEAAPARLFPRAAVADAEETTSAVQAAEAEEAATAGRAGMAPMAGAPGAAGAGAAGQQKERKRADYLSSREHLEDTFEEPIGVLPVVGDVE